MQEKYIWSRVWRNVLCSLDCEVYFSFANLLVLFVLIFLHCSCDLTHCMLACCTAQLLYPLVFSGCLDGMLLSFLLWLQLENIKEKYDQELVYYTSTCTFFYLVERTTVGRINAKLCISIVCFLGLFSSIVFVYRKAAFFTECGKSGASCC